MATPTGGWYAHFRQLAQQPADWWRKVHHNIAVAFPGHALRYLSNGGAIVARKVDEGMTMIEGVYLAPGTDFSLGFKEPAAVQGRVQRGTSVSDSEIDSALDFLHRAQEDGELSPGAEEFAVALLSASRVRGGYKLYKEPPFSVKENPGRRPGPFRSSRWSSTHHSFDQRDRERTKAKQFWNSLTDSERFELGDQLVLGVFEWRDWLTAPPSRAFLDEVDRLRIDWEIVGG